MAISVIGNNGKIRSLDDLFEEAVENMVDVLNDLSDDDQFELGNLYRDKNGYNLLYRNTEDEINEILDGESPYDIIQMDYDEYADYFLWSWGSLDFTSDPFEDLDIEELARAILNEEFHYRDLPSDVQDAFDEFEEARNALDNMNEGRKMAYNVVAKYMNCQADVSDLLVVLSKLARTDEYWSED